MVQNGKIDKNPTGSSHREQLVAKRLTLMTMLEHNLYTNWMVFLKINPTLTPKKTYVKFCCVVRNHTSLKNTSTTSTYFLQSKPLLVDPRECSLMNLTNLIITMMAHTDYSINNFLLFSSSYSLPAFSAFSFSLFCDFSCL